MKGLFGTFVATVLLGFATAAIGADAMRDACAPDYKQFCNDVKPGGGRIIQCLRQNSDKLSPACKDAMKAAEAKKKG